jgi:hypothetical protein
MVLGEMKEGPPMTQREQLVYLAWVAEQADRYDDALDALSRLVDLEQLLEDNPTTGCWWAWEDVNLAVDTTIRLIEEDVRPMVWVSSKVLFEERMVVERMGPLLHTTTDTERELSSHPHHGMRVRVASALHQRAQARMERLCAQCMRLLDQAVDHDDIAAALAHQPTDNYMAEEWASLYYRMHVSLSPSPSPSVHVVVDGLTTSKRLGVCRKGDMLAYQAQCRSGDERSALVTQAFTTYEVAQAAHAGTHRHPPGCCCWCCGKGTVPLHAWAR